MYSEISSPMDYHAALYIRLSKEDENEGPSQSVTNQESLLREFVRQQRLDVYDTYIDDGWSGTNFDRPDFQRMIADIEAKRVNMVITKDLSRLGRDYIMTGHYMERYFPEHRVRYISLLDGIDTGVDSTANDITPFRAIMNDMYAKDISKKIKSVKRDKQRKGQFIGGKPVYGYKMHPTEKNKIVIDEAVAPVVRRIFGMALSGMSCRQIATRLNEEHIPTPATYAGLPVGKPGPYTGLWSSERISDMLQNETYIGNMVQGRSRKINYKTKKCIRQQPKDWVVVEGTHEPLIDRETFDKVRRLVDSRKHTRSRTYDFLLKGLIFCHECGYPLAVLNRKNAAGEDVLRAAFLMGVKAHPVCCRSRADALRCEGQLGRALLVQPQQKIRRGGGPVISGLHHLAAHLYRNIPQRGAAVPVIQGQINISVRFIHFQITKQTCQTGHLPNKKPASAGRSQLHSDRCKFAAASPRCAPDPASPTQGHRAQRRGWRTPAGAALRRPAPPDFQIFFHPVEELCQRNPVQSIVLHLAVAGLLGNCRCPLPQIQQVAPDTLIVRIQAERIRLSPAGFRCLPRHASFLLMQRAGNGTR